MHPCGHAVPAQLPADAITVRAGRIGVVVNDRDGATEISLYVELPTPVGAACIRLDGAQYAHLRTTLNALSTMSAEQIRTLDAQLQGTGCAHVD